MKASERRLITVLTAVLALCGGIVGVGKLRSWQTRLAREEDSLGLERMELTGLLNQSQHWRERGAWLEANQPITASSHDADEELFNTLLAKAQAAGVSVVSEQFQEPRKNAHYHQSGVSLVVKGDLGGLFRWICSVQSPERFFVVPSIRITPDKADPSKIDGAVQFWRWYRPLAPKTT